MSEQQEQGCYPRLNGKMVLSGEYTEKIISLVGIFVQDDGQTATMQCCDGSMVQFSHSPDSDLKIGNMVVEAIGLVSSESQKQTSVEVSLLRTSMAIDASCLESCYCS